MHNPMDLAGRTILVTGASSGIGRETSIVLAGLGARLVLVGRRREELERTAASLGPGGHRVVPFDLSDLDAIPAWLRGVGDSAGPLDDLVHSAGLHFTLPLRATPTGQYTALMRVNVDAAYFLAKGFRQKGTRRAGSTSGIVFLSSVMGLIGQTGISAYSASKGALVSMAKSLALELAREGIRVNCVAPGVVRTEMAEHAGQTLTPEQHQALESLHPLGMGTPRDVAYAVAFLLAETGRWITGTTLVVDGGYTAQ
jgi:NAD(P)-dependent dehydrogenase (short-subunit alcohol dehydrogenase family)